MMRNILLFLLFIVLASSCKHEEPPHLPREKMIDIMKDIHLAEVYSSMVDASEERTTNKNMDSLVKYYNIVFNTHNITQEDFNKSVDWYAKHPKELDSVYTHMLTHLSELDGLLSNTNSD